MASQIGNVSRDGRCANSSTKCANDDVAMDDAKAWNSTGKSAVVGGMGHSGLCATRKYGGGDQHANRLHLVDDIRKSVFTLRIRVFTDSSRVGSNFGPALCDR
ncbi:hypothetical protein PQR01_16865 [Paraburkholderia rhynchosiae]|uniref:Uncharacterized protein n=2 Tax=Paraburkholderia TaxID=1822464 RepID=A0ACC7NDE5_9BURK